MTAPEPVFFDQKRRYRIVDELGSGSFGVVYRVVDTRFREEVALKTTRDTSPDEQRWLRREWRIQQGWYHPNLVQTDLLMREGERFYFTMDLVPDGAPFNVRLKLAPELSDDEWTKALKRLCRAAVQLADALDTVHLQNTCHGDVKPDNVLVTHDDQVRLVDFGLNRPLDGAAPGDTTRGALLGTPRYIAPEQYHGAPPSFASDWYSMGLLLYESLTDHFPFRGQTLFELGLEKQRPVRPPREINPRIPAELEVLVLEMLDPDPRNRPDGGRILAQLCRLADVEVVRGSWAISEIALNHNFVARDDELDRLRDAYDRCVAGQPTTIEVIGTTGIGKTALVRHFLHSLRAHPTPPLALTASCHHLEDIPYKAFDAVIDDLTRHWTTLPDSDARDLCPDHGFDELTQLFEQLEQVRKKLNLPVGRSARLGDPRAIRQLGFQALREILGRLRRPDQPVVLWVDDLQWADPASIELLEWVFGRDEAPAILVILSHRPISGRDNPELHAAVDRLAQRDAERRIDLEQLAPAAAAELVRTIVADADVPAEEVARAVLTEAEGATYLISELAHFVVRRLAHGLSQRADSHDSSLMQARLAELDAEDRELLELAALSPEPVTASVLLAAAGGLRRRRLLDLCVRRLLRWTPSRDEEAEEEFLQIYHDILGDAVTRSMSPEVKARHHLRLVEEMEKADSAERPQDAEQMLYHAMQAADADRTFRHATTAAARAAGALRFELAVKHYTTALECRPPSAPVTALHAGLAEALAHCGRSMDAATVFEQAITTLAAEDPDNAVERAYFHRRAGEQFLKAGHFRSGEQILSQFLAASGFRLPRSGWGALLTSGVRRISLYLRLYFRPYLKGDERDSQPSRIGPNERREPRLAGLWGATTALSMTDPIRADSVGLLHFHESLTSRNHYHAVLSYMYEVAFAALFAYAGLSFVATKLLERSKSALTVEDEPYLLGFYDLCAGIAAFFDSDWETATELLDKAALHFRTKCEESEYEAAVAIVFSLQALGHAGAVARLVEFIPEAIREATDRKDLFAANNYRGGFHALGRIAAGQIDAVVADLEIVDDYLMQVGADPDVGSAGEAAGGDRATTTAKSEPGFYQMHAYHRVFARVSAYLYNGDPRAALALIDADWSDLRRGLFLIMKLPAMELRWTRARACLAVAAGSDGRERDKLLRRARRLVWWINCFGTKAAARAHAALLEAGIAAVKGDDRKVERALRAALGGYSQARMAVHREVARWALGQLVGGGEGRACLDVVADWRAREGVASMPPLARAVAPGVELALRCCHGNL